MNDKAKDAEVIKLTHVRCSYPHLFRRAVFDGDEGKFEITFLIDKDDPQVQKLKRHINKIRKGLSFKVAADKICLRDGDELGRPETEGCYNLKASTGRRPVVLNRDKSAIAEDDGIIYGGCFVNATIDFWVQNNKWGKRINCNLRAVQFDSDGEAFGAGPVDDDDMFEELGGGESESADDDDFDDDLDDF